MDEDNLLYCLGKPVLLTIRSLHDYTLIPQPCMEGLQRYVKDGTPTGDFLHAVLCNDLKEAVGRADEQNLWLLPIYCHWLYNEAPSPCWGSPERVERWIQMKLEARERARNNQPEGRSNDAS